MTAVPLCRQTAASSSGCSLTHVDVPVLVPAARATPVVGQPDMPPSDRGPAAPLRNFATPVVRPDMSGEDPGKSATRDDMKYMEDRCPVTELEAWDRARHESTVASWAFGLGGASLAAGVVVYLLAPSSERASTALRLSPLLGTKSAGLAATGRF